MIKPASADAGLVFLRLAPHGAPPDGRTSRAFAAPPSSCPFCRLQLFMLRRTSAAACCRPAAPRRPLLRTRRPPFRPVRPTRPRSSGFPAARRPNKTPTSVPEAATADRALPAPGAPRCRDGPVLPEQHGLHRPPIVPAPVQRRRAALRVLEQPERHVGAAHRRERWSGMLVGASWNGDRYDIAQLGALLLHFSHHLLVRLFVRNGRRIADGSELENKAARSRGRRRDVRGRCGRSGGAEHAGGIGFHHRGHDRVSVHRKAVERDRSGGSGCRSSKSAVRRLSL
eukprot:4852841-Prymnesium_polylepis.2